MRSAQVVVGTRPVSPDGVVRVARDGVGVRLADDALAEIAEPADCLAGVAALARAIEALA